MPLPHLQSYKRHKLIYTKYTSKVTNDVIYAIPGLAYLGKWLEE